MTKIEEKPAYVSREEKNGLTQDFLNAHFDYKDGILYRKIRTSNSVQIGDLAGNIITDKYKSRCEIGIKGDSFYAHRLIFCMHKGYFPEFVDHIDHNTLNNRIENLRAATKIENNRNGKSRKSSSSQYLGVFKTVRDSGAIRWLAQIGINKKSTHIGSFQTEEEAAFAYNRMAVKHFGEFANLNIIKKPINIPNID